ncbi:uncharacterized protein BPTFM16_00726 [Altererythrobacter insulae]|nr:uncharacterized protein BPTFM16_00726 [Altererythrobacter insulae]
MIDSDLIAEGIAAARPRVIAALAAQFRDLDLAEEALSDSVEALLNSPDDVSDLAAWLFVAGKRKSIDIMRKRARERSAHDDLAEEIDMGEVITLPDPIPDERLRLLFICCHPAIALEARTALALKVICGLPVSEIARVFIVPEATMYQRITRAKQKVAKAGIPFELPHRSVWTQRLDAVLLTLELAYTVAFQEAAGHDEGRTSAEVERLALMLADLLPENPEALGFAAMVLFARSREAARLDQAGAMVPLSRQDCEAWDRARINKATELLGQAAQLKNTGRFQLMASIQLTHARRLHDGKVDWRAIIQLYDALLCLQNDPAVALNRAVAEWKLNGPEAGLEALEQLPNKRFENFRPWHVARANILAELGQRKEASRAFKAALHLAPAPAERPFLQRRLAELTG